MSSANSNPVEMRSAGLVVPLFSIRSESSWGVGEFPDLGELAPWLREAGFSLLSLLPLLEVALGQSSPYSALSAFALDPIYLALEEIEEFDAIGGIDALSEQERAELDRLRASPGVEYGAVRRLKETWLRRSFAQFEKASLGEGSERAREFARFRAEHSDWLADYSLFRALKEANPHGWWQTWPQELQERHPGALAKARSQYRRACTYFEWLQWLANQQLVDARRRARDYGVLLAGDLPFMVAEDSADAWSRQQQLRTDATIGTPPDAFSKEGQDWGLPAYRWESLAGNGYDWLRERGQRTAEAFDLVRVDHVVGFYRTFTRPKDKSRPFFSPSEEHAQIRQGEAVLQALASSGTALIAEDLGTVPPFVRRSLTELGVPGFRVLRWERDEKAFHDPRKWPALSVATTGTHDTDPSASWWEQLDEEERQLLLEIPTLSQLGEESRHFDARVHRALLETVYASGSNLLLLPIQDLFGSRERTNTPGTVNGDNWSYRLPWTIAALANDRHAVECTRMASELAHRHGRQPG